MKHFFKEIELNNEELYEQNYESTIKELERKAEAGNFNLETVRNELEALYNYDGLGWAGRGLVKGTQIDAAIAAYEAFISRRRKAG